MVLMIEVRGMLVVGMLGDGAMVERTGDDRSKGTQSERARHA